jgi:hypothetical protein
MSELTKDIVNKLSAPFPENELRVRVGATSENTGKALAIPYIDARCVMDRLDDVVGPANWSYEYQWIITASGHIAADGKLTVMGVTRCDCGEADAEGEPYKAAVSDTLKRCAVGFGIGRYLYSMPKEWFPFKTVGRNKYFEDENAVLSALVAISNGKPAPKQQPKAAGKQTTTEVVYATIEQKNQLKELLQDRFGDANEEINKFIANRCGKALKFSQISRTDAAKMISELEKK